MTKPFQLGETILDVKGVSLTLGGNLILGDVTVRVQNVVRPDPITQGQVIAFLGPSGKGKTQFSKILAGLRPPDSGEVLINNPPTPVKAGMVGYVTQNYFLRPNRTVLDNLLIAARRAGLKHSEAHLKSAEYLAFFGLTDFSDRYPAQLSGGQRQRVAIAQQLLCSSHFLIMDEPFSGLDPIMKEKVCELIIKVSLMDEFNTIIVISHDIRAALKVSDTVWLLGQDQDSSGNLIPGSRIKYTYNLMDRGMCWDPDVFQTSEFNQLVLEIESLFKSL